MSCDFDIECLDCGRSCGFHDLNWGGDWLLAAMKYRAELTAPGFMSDPDTWWFRDECSRTSKVIEFFGAHPGHDLAVVSEYGHVYEGTCHAGSTGPGFCMLAKGHEGSHLVPERLVRTDCGWRRPTRLETMTGAAP